MNLFFINNAFRVTTVCIISLSFIVSTQKTQKNTKKTFFNFIPKNIFILRDFTPSEKSILIEILSVN